MVDVQAVMRAMSQSAEMESGQLDEQARKPVITISRTIGSGGEEIAHELAKRLGVKCYGSLILDSIAKQGKVNNKTMTLLHEKHSKSSTAWLYSMLSGRNVKKDDYLHFLEVTIRWLYHKGGVILGRGGNLVLTGRDVLRVRIAGSVETCAKRIAMQDRTSLAEAKKKVRESNKDRGELIWKMFRKRLNDPLHFDLTINTDHFSDYSHVTDIIVQALESMGLDKPQTKAAKK